jgi:molybdopterin synthase catalytic subunit
VEGDGMPAGFYAEIRTSPLSLSEAELFIRDNAHGGSVIFQGSIRDFNQGRNVLTITYDVHESLALKSFKEIYNATISHWGEKFKIYISPYKGRLTIKEISMLVAVSSVHRQEAFEVAKFIVEAIKHSVPIWKQEQYVDGHSEWVVGHALCSPGGESYCETSSNKR